MSDDLSGVSRSSWIAIPQAMQQHGQAKRAIASRALPSKETAPGDNVATATTERSEPKLP